MSQQKLPRGILPDGITLPPGTDIMQFCRDLAESGADFTEQFDRESATFHGDKYGGARAVPIGGARVPESMGGYAAEGKEIDAANWRALPDAPMAIEEDFGPDYHAAMAAHKQLGDCKKAISVLNKPVETAMRLRLQYKAAEAGSDDMTALKSRLAGAENDRDGALSAATEAIRKGKGFNDSDISERTRACVDDVAERGKFHFEDKETFGEYIQVLQRANQAIFADQKKLLARIKEIKKAAKTTQVVTSVEKSEATPAGEAVPTSATVAAGA